MSDWQDDDWAPLFLVRPDVLMSRMTGDWRKEQENKPITLNSKLSAALNKCPSPWINGICKQLGLDPKALRAKKRKVAAIQAHLADLVKLGRVVQPLPAASRQALSYVLEQGGWVKLGQLTRRFGTMDDVGWFWGEDDPPVSPLGQLRVRGLLFVGKAGFKGRNYGVAVVPKDLREPLGDLLAEEGLAS